MYIPLQNVERSDVLIIVFFIIFIIFFVANHLFPLVEVVLLTDDKHYPQAWYKRKFTSADAIFSFDQHWVIVAEIIVY